VGLAGCATAGGSSAVSKAVTPPGTESVPTEPKREIPRSRQIRLMIDEARTNPFALPVPCRRRALHRLPPASSGHRRTLRPTFTIPNR